jgi:hypothetical protein
MAMVPEAVLAPLMPPMAAAHCCEPRQSKVYEQVSARPGPAAALNAQTKRTTGKRRLRAEKFITHTAQGILTSKFLLRKGRFGMNPE